MVTVTIVIKQVLLHASYPTLMFSTIAFVVIPSRAERINCLTHVLFLTTITCKKVDQAFIVTIKFVVYNICFTCNCAGKS